MSSISRPNRAFFLLLAIGVFLRVLYLFEFSALENFSVAVGADISEYHARALEILNGRLFPVQPEIHAPLYSFFLAGIYALGGSVVLVRIVQTVLNLGAWCALYLFAGKCGFSTKLRLFFFGFAMVCAPLIFHPAELISESLLIPLFTLSVFLLQKGEYEADGRGRSGYLAGAGAAAALAALTHSLALTFIGAELLCFLLVKQWKRALLFAAGAMILILPVIGVKSLHYGKFCAIQANGGFNFYLGNHAGADGRCRIRPGLEWRKLHRQAEKEAAARNISADRLWAERALDFWNRHPVQGALLYGKKALMVFSGREFAAGSDNAAVFRRTGVIFCTEFFSWFLTVAGLSGMILMAGRRDWRWKHFLLLAAALLAAQVLTVTSGRYRLVMWPAFLMGAAYLCGLFRGKGSVWLVCGALGVIVTGRFLDDSPSEEERREAAEMLGEAAYVKKDYSRAAALLAPLAGSGQMLDGAHVWNLLGSISQSTPGFPVPPHRCFAAAVKAEPEMPEGWMNLANVTPEPRMAEQYYKEALKRGEPSAKLAFNYAFFLWSTKRESEALKWNTAALQTDPALAPAWNLAGVAAMKAKNFSRAAECFARAHQLEPAEPGYANNLQAARSAGGNL